MLARMLKAVIAASDPTRAVLSSPGASFHCGRCKRLLNRLEGRLRILKRHLKLVGQLSAKAFPSIENIPKLFHDSMEDKSGLDKWLLEDLLQDDQLESYIPMHQRISLEDLVNATQGYQAFFIKVIIERLRLLKYNLNNGVMHYCFNDCHPAISYSVVDYWGHAKKGYYAIKESFEPLQAIAKLKLESYLTQVKEEIPLFLVNDTSNEYNDISVEALVMLNDELVTCGQWTRSIEADGRPVELGRLRFDPFKPGLYELKTKLYASQGVIHNNYELLVI